VRTESIERVTLIFPGALGDFLLALPALRALRARHAPARLTTVVSAPLVSLARLAGVGDEVASLDAASSAWLFGGSVSPPWIRDRPTVYSWLGSGDPLARARVSQAARTARFFAIERGAGGEHAAVGYAHAVGAPAGLAELGKAGRLDAPPSPAADRIHAALRAPVLAIHPGAGADRKRWAAGGFIEVADWWRRRGGSVLELGGPAEAGQLLGDAFLARDLPLPDLAAALARAALYVGNDSGVSHLAGAVGAAGVVLFGPTPARRWGPLAGRLTALQALDADDPEGIPLAALPPALVVAACQRIVDTAGDARSPSPVDKGGPRY